MSSKGSRMLTLSANVYTSTEAHKRGAAHREREKAQTHLDLGRSAAAKPGLVRPSGGGTERSVRAAPGRHPRPRHPRRSRLSRGGGGGSVRLPRHGDGSHPGGEHGQPLPSPGDKGTHSPGPGETPPVPGQYRAETEGRTGADARPGMVPPQRDSPRVQKGRRGAAAPTAPGTAPHSPDSAGQVTPSPQPRPARTFKGGGRKRRGATAAPVPAPQ